ncbi:MAG: site-specific DNA-methyltransferase (adenine-specific) [Verrucomicrobiales bacterium]|jgi:site-specific DNA-methyltransferase (adenine-specific)
MSFHLIHGDCVAGMREHLADESIDLVVTSPPYNLGIKYSKYEDKLEREEYLAWSMEWAGEVRRVLKPDGSFFLNVGAAPKNPMMPHEIILALSKTFVLQNTIHWIKSITVKTRDGQQISAGHFKPINSKRYVNDCHEYLFHLTKEGDVPVARKAVGVPYQDKSNISRWGHTEGGDRRCRGNNWFIPYKTIKARAKERPHPATFPVELAEKCILLHGKGEETVMLEPFLGIGHAAEAARACGVKEFYGFEIDEDYLAVARERLERTML